MIQNNNWYVSQSEFWQYFFKNKNGNLLLEEKIEKNKNNYEQLFCDFVNVINVELSAYCNRKCSYCPISEYPRIQADMPDDIYNSIISELMRIDFRNTISISLFNEPLADKNIIKKIKDIHDKLPYCYIRFNSNGDYLTKKMLDSLSEAGCKEIQITMHFSANEKYNDTAAKEKIHCFFEKLNIPYKIKAFKENHNITVDFIYKNIRLLVLTNNWAEDGNSRGGIVKNLNCRNRYYPCATPFREIAIDINGNLRRCCNMFVTSDALYNVKDISLVDFFFSTEMTNLRRNLLKYNDERIEPCDTCNTWDYSENFDSNVWNSWIRKNYNI